MLSRCGIHEWVHGCEDKVTLFLILRNEVDE